MTRVSGRSRVRRLRISKQGTEPRGIGLGGGQKVLVSSGLPFLIYRIAKSSFGNVRALMLASSPPVVGVLSKGSGSPLSRRLFCTAGSMGRRGEGSARGRRSEKVRVVEIVYQSQAIKAVLAAALETGP